MPIKRMEGAGVDGLPGDGSLVGEHHVAVADAVDDQAGLGPVIDDGVADRVDLVPVQVARVEGKSI